MEEDEDSPEFQKARVEYMVSQLAPGKLVEFDFPNIKFKIIDPATRKRVTANSRTWKDLTELADESDKSLLFHIKKLLERKI